MLLRALNLFQYFWAFFLVIYFRPNLFLSVSMKSNAMNDLKSLMVQKNGRWEFEGPTIIYCPTKKAAEETENMVKCMIY